MNNKENINLKELYIEILSKYTENQSFIEKSFKKISRKYSDKNRFYHTMKHISDMIEIIFSYKDKVSDFEILIISTFFHDYFYKSTKLNNEEKSAEKAFDILSKTNFEKHRIEKVKSNILRTKNHSIENSDDDFDIKLFLDSDLKILSAEFEEYINYTHSIKKEYKLIPENIFKKNRIIFLEKTLTSKSIYKTEIFKNNFEEKARENIKTELSILQK